MIYQGLYKILDFYFELSGNYYKRIDDYFKNYLEQEINLKLLEDDKKGNLRKNLRIILEAIQKKIIQFGFDDVITREKFSEPYLQFTKYDMTSLSSWNEIYKKMVLPLIYELLFEEILKYLANLNPKAALLELIKMEVIPIEIDVKMRNLKELFGANPGKIENLQKYLKIQKSIINEFQKNKDSIESLEDLKETTEKIQLLYFIYRILDFFHLQYVIDFSHLEVYLKDHLKMWLTSIPLVSLRNPELYYCGIFLAHHLNIKINEQEVKSFLNDFFDEVLNEFEFPLLEASSKVYYLIKSLDLLKVEISDEKKFQLVNIESNLLDTIYLRELETAHLIVILKCLRMLKLSKLLESPKLKGIRDEIETRVTLEGIKHTRDGLITSEATYYMIFHRYANNTLEQLKDLPLLEDIITRIYQNLELLVFSKDTNYDLFSEIFYSCESLNLLNCIECKETLLHLTKYLFPEEIHKQFMDVKDFSSPKTRFRHFYIDKITGNTLYLSDSEMISE